MASPVERNTASAASRAPAQMGESAAHPPESPKIIDSAMPPSSFRTYVPHLTSIIKMDEETLPDEAIQTLTLVQAIFIAQTKLFFRGEQGSHKITKDALLSFFSHQFYYENTLGNFTKMYEDFWKCCGVPAKEIEDLIPMAHAVGMVRRCTDFFNDQLGSKTANFLSCRQQMLQSLAKSNAKFLQLMVPYWTETGQEMSGLLDYFNTIENTTKEAKQSIRQFFKEHIPEGFVDSQVRVAYKTLISIATPLLQPLPSTVNGIRRLAPYLTTMDVNNMSGARRVNSMLGNLNQAQKAALSLAVDAHRYELNICVARGVYPKSPTLRKEVILALKNEISIARSFVNYCALSLLKKDDDPNLRAMQKEIKLRVKFGENQANKGLTCIDLKDVPAINKEYATRWNQAVKIINEEILKIFSGLYTAQKELVKKNISTLIKRAFQRIQSLGNKENYLCAARTVHRELEYISKSYETEEGLKGELEDRRINKWCNYSPDDFQVDTIAKLEYQAFSIHQSMVSFTNLLETLKDGEVQLKKELDDKALVVADEVLTLLNLEEEHNARIADTVYAKTLAEQQELKGKETRSAATITAATAARVPLETAAGGTIAVSSSAGAGAAAAPLMPVISRLFVPRSVVDSPFNTRLSEHIFDLRHCVSLFHEINPADPPVLPADVAGLEVPLVQLALQRQLYWLDSLAASVQLYQHIESPLERTAARNQIILSAYTTAEQAAVTVFCQRYPYRFLQHDLAMLLKKSDIDLSPNFLTEHGNSATYYLRYPKCHRVTTPAATPFLLRCMLERSPKVADEFHQRLPDLIDAVMKITVAVLEASPQAPQQQGLLEHMRKVFMQTVVTDMSVQQKEKIETSLSKEEGEKLVKCQRDLDIGISMLEKKIAAEQATQIEIVNELHHIMNRLIDIRGTVGLCASRPLQSFLWRHLHHLIFSTQYFAENLGTLLSIKRGEEVRKHSLEMYCREYGLDNGLSSTQKALIELLNISKGSEYLYGWEEAATEGLIGKLGQLYARAKEALILGEGARTVRPGRVDRTLQELQGDVVEWVTKFVDLALALQRLHL